MTGLVTAQRSFNVRISLRQCCNPAWDFFPTTARFVPTRGVSDVVVFRARGVRKRPRSVSRFGDSLVWSIPACRFHQDPDFSRG